MSGNLKNILILFISILLLFAWWTSLHLGLSTDEYFHHINGLKRYNFLVSLGADKNFNFGNNELYPGLYDTLSYALGQLILLINKKFYANNIDFVMHLVNITFSSLSILGLYIFTKKILNKNIALLSILLTLLNPFFFGHMGMNPKDIIIFFSLIWSCYYFYRYFINSQKFKDLIFASFFVGFGCGVRLPFLILVFPIIVSGLVFLIYNYRSQYLNLFLRSSIHFLVSLLIISFLILLCWPHMLIQIQNGNFLNFLSSNILNSMNFHGPRTGLINGEYYEVFDTPKAYFLNIIIYRLPFYYTILVLISYLFILTKKLTLKNEIKNFNIKFLILNLIPFFPILITIIMGIGVYDNLRLFLFIIPFFSIIGSLSLYELINYSKNSWKFKTITSIIIILFSISLYRFISLTPYQYDYVNYSSLKFKNAEYKWEHDYWGASYKELILNIKNNFSDEEIKKLKITNCVGDDTLLYYLYRYLGIKKIYRNKLQHEANHVVLINRANLNIFNNPDIEGLVDKDGVILVKDLEKIVRTPGVKTTCNKQFSGEDVITVSRNGVTLSALRKLDN